MQWQGCKAAWDAAWLPAHSPWGAPFTEDQQCCGVLSSCAAHLSHPSMLTATHTRRKASCPPPLGPLGSLHTTEARGQLRQALGVKAAGLSQLQALQVLLENLPPLLPDRRKSKCGPGTGWSHQSLLQHDPWLVKPGQRCKRQFKKEGKKGTELSTQCSSHMQHTL